MHPCGPFRPCTCPECGSAVETLPCGTPGTGPRQPARWMTPCSSTSADGDHRRRVAAQSWRLWHGPGTRQLLMPQLDWLFLLLRWRSPWAGAGVLLCLHVAHGTQTHEGVPLRLALVINRSPDHNLQCGMQTRGP